MSKRKKISKLQIFRIIVQIIFFIILPGLYANAFAGIKIIYQGIITGNFSLYNEFPSLLAAVSIFPITIILGRFFCGWICAFGALGDWLFEATNKIFKYKKRVPQNIDNVLKLVKYIVLFLFFAFIWNMDLSELDAANPWISFGLLAKVTQTPDLANAVNGFMAGTIILVIIMVISIFVERFFCRYLCPLGALFTLISVLGITKISKPKSNCGSCKLCTSKCSMGINLDKYDIVKSGECIQCYKCVSVCPKSNASPSVFKKKMSGSYAGSVAVLSITVIFYFFTMITGVFVSGSSNTYLTNQVGTGQYIDGIYEGSGQGFRGETIVSVTITNGFISNIEVISYNDDTEYFDRAFNAVSSSIISSQKTIVDGVSGATYSSDGIMAAVENALENAKNIVAEESIQKSKPLLKPKLLLNNPRRQPGQITRPPHRLQLQLQHRLLPHRYMPTVPIQALELGIEGVQLY